jgi:hypothetical protein
MVNLFSDVEKGYRKRFIDLYEEFLKNPLGKEAKKMAEGMGSLTCPNFCEEINEAAAGAYKIESGEMSEEEAKKILNKLQFSN